VGWTFASPPAHPMNPQGDYPPMLDYYSGELRTLAAGTEKPEFI